MNALPNTARAANRAKVFGRHPVKDANLQHDVTDQIEPERAEFSHPRTSAREGLAAISAIVLGLFLLQIAIPLGTAVQIGADEGFEFAKATLCVKGHRLYTEIWNDQPPLHTFLITQVLKHVSYSPLGPRLVTTGFTILLLTSLFLVIRRVSGLLIAGLGVALLIASPGFVELSSSCMLEIPALAMAAAGLCVLVAGRPSRWYLREIAAGAIFGLGLQIKLVPIILLSLAVFILWSQNRDGAASLRRTMIQLAVLGSSLLISYVAVDFLIEGGAYLRHFGQTWASHFGRAKSFEYGSAEEHHFAWNVLIRNWDATIPAVLGIVLVARCRKLSLTLLPIGWLALSLVVFPLHKPWWSYYYIHLAIPLCWLAAIGWVFVYERARARTERKRRRPRWRPVLLSGFAVCALVWLGARLYLQVSGIRESPQTYNTLVLGELERYKPFTQWLYCERLVYSFHSGIPLPPDLAVMPVKRFWAGEMDNARLNAKMCEIKPGLVLLRNDGHEVAFQDLINSEYRLIYHDFENRLFAHVSISRLPAQ